MKSRPSTTPQTPLSMVGPAGERPTFPLVHQHLNGLLRVGLTKKREPYLVAGRTRCDRGDIVGIRGPGPEPLFAFGSTAGLGAQHVLIMGKVRAVALSIREIDLQEYDRR